MAIVQCVSCWFVNCFIRYIQYIVYKELVTNHDNLPIVSFACFMTGYRSFRLRSISCGKCSFYNIWLTSKFVGANKDIFQIFPMGGHLLSPCGALNRCTFPNSRWYLIPCSLQRKLRIKDSVSSFLSRYKAVNIKLYFIDRHFRSSTSAFSFLISSDSAAGCMIGWKTCFFSLILVT